MAAGTSIITEQSPYIVRTSFTLPQSTVTMAEWALKNGIKKVVSMVSDYAPGIDAENSFKEEFTAKGGERDRHHPHAARQSRLRAVPAARRRRKPDAMFIFVPAGQGGVFIKQFVERGLDKAGIKIIGPGDVTDDDVLNGMGEPVIGTVTAHIYSAGTISRLNKAFVAAFKKANNGMRPNFMSVGGYDGMHLIYEALKKTGGKTDGDAHRRRDEGHGLGEPARPDLDRSGNPRHHPEHLHPQGREGRRRALQRRVRHVPERQGSGQGCEEEMQ